ncbi:glycoside hydrolase domain-containing protein [Streptomyces katsurahamanus]|uniref:DUF1906 domain-containing protein n=1 Tax=Streptomyces katsurahamanus TaxID=2577098 RepID=A0ABW9NSF7_9ACTN|nr:glycoside hydrolase domain-containing protein [Streptomyces katsurahamanus]MQS36004.1 DUF1906 domain-containing protein [Streptomyces katsurahamanus]
MADEQVLRAQKWVNLTYGNVPGYVRCPETGNTGWSTMNSLIMGLQHELGISPLVASFGATTYAKFAALGDIGFGWEQNRNIVSILEFGLWCKGYWAVEPGSEGWFTGVTRAAVEKIRGDMGIGGAGVINAKIARAILNMDAYVVVMGGSEKIRSIQQWLNGRYWSRSEFNIGPCDGIYSRDVQKSLMYAIQYELNLTPTGNFGPATQAGLKANTVGPGSSGIFMQLFSSACVFNEPIPRSDPSRTNVTESWNSAIQTWVTKFQAFSKLTESGRGDYQTWAQLLVSMGDPDRDATGSDTRFEITASRAKWLFDNKYRVVGRYIYDPPGSTLDKEIKPGELQTIFDAGLRVFPIYQDNARQLSDFSYTQGYQHALNAHQLASGYGFNRGTTIYFAVDYDATQEEIDGDPNGIVKYFHGVQAGLASKDKKYNHGVYGSRNVCINVTAKTSARASFVSGMSWGFSGNLGFPLPENWAFNQIKEFKVTNGADTFDLDRNVISNIDTSVSSVNDPAGPADSFITYVTRLYQLAGEYGATGTRRSELVMEYIRHKDYGDYRWNLLIGEFDTGFRDFANSKGMKVEKFFKDPFTGYSLGAEHLMATANAHLLIDHPGSLGEANGGDVGGWAGDLMTFWTDWRNSETEYPNPLDFGHAKLAVPGVTSSFSFTDFIEDADGYHIARAVRGNKTIVQAVTEHYAATGGGLRRFNNYFTQRWGNSTACKNSANYALCGTNTKIMMAQAGLITLSGAVLPNDYKLYPGGTDKVNGFCQGFVDAINARRGLESRMAATYRANHQRFLREARARAQRRQ